MLTPEELQAEKQNERERWSSVMRGLNLRQGTPEHARAVALLSETDLSAETIKQQVLFECQTSEVSN